VAVAAAQRAGRGARRLVGAAGEAGGGWRSRARPKRMAASWSGLLQTPRIQECRRDAPRPLAGSPRNVPGQRDCHD
jgi:hypothetical protein